MTRRRPTTPARTSRGGHPAKAISFLLVTLALAVAACGGSSTTSSPTSGATATTSIGPSGQPSSPGASSPSPTDEPTASDEPSPSDEPTDGPTDEPTPTDEPSASPSSEVSPSPGAAAACTGTANNQDFYAKVASLVSWTVYCAVLPTGWHVDAGHYGSGQMVISYKGPGGDRIVLSEGAFCSASDGCVPAGTDVGDAPFGDLPGTLVSADDGSWAIVVDRGSKLSWLLMGTGLDEATLRGFGAALSLVEG